MIIIIVTIYIVGVIAMWVWDSFVGFGYDFDGNTNWPLPAVCWLWMLSLPIIIFCKLSDWLDNVKTKRLAKEAHLGKLRVKAEQEVNAIMQQIDYELRADLESDIGAPIKSRKYVLEIK